MSDYKPITGELRNGGWRLLSTVVGDEQYVQKFDADKFDQLCDAIDAIHANLERENARLSRELRDRPIAVGPDALETVARLERENANLNAVNTALEEANDAMRKRLLELTEPDLDGWIELPKDADGVPIHVGDLIRSTFVGEVFAIGLRKDGWHVHTDQWSGHDFNTMHHHYQPDTWESIIYDAVAAGRTDKAVDLSPIIRRCKALAGDAE